MSNLRHILILAALLLAGCAREQRNFREATPSNETGEGVQMSDIAPGHLPSGSRMRIPMRTALIP